MNIQELKKKTSEALITQAEELGVENASTLRKLEILFAILKKLAIDNGCKQYTRIPALGTNEDFIKCISDLIVKKNEYKFNNYLYPPIIKCPSNLKKCPCLNYE